MRNISSTAIKSVPTRLILKQGDDLRQDMITLKMFSLFQKVSPIISFVTCLLSYTSSLQLWEKDGLPNMCLIPYGCMATSPKTGFIEVVKSARTIAEVMTVRLVIMLSYRYTKQYHCISAWAVLVKTSTCVWLLYLRFWLNLFCCTQVSAINNKTNLFECPKSIWKRLPSVVIIMLSLWRSPIPYRERMMIVDYEYVSLCSHQNICCYSIASTGQSEPSYSLSQLLRIILSKLTV